MLNHTPTQQEYETSLAVLEVGQVGKATVTLLGKSSIRNKANALLAQAVLARQLVLLTKFVAAHGRAALAGPFKGMLMSLDNDYAGDQLPRLLGVYEYQLDATVRKIMATPYRTLINLGSSEGHYAIGFARAMPDTRVIATELKPMHQERCRAYAALNGVAERVTVTGGLDGAALDAVIEGRTVIVADIEGAEDEVLDPVQVPKLAQCDILVELHECFKPGLIERTRTRFAATHDFQLIDIDEGKPELPPVAKTMTELDRMLLVYECRDGYTPWAWLTAKNPAA